MRTYSSILGFDCLASAHSSKKQAAHNAAQEGVERVMSERHRPTQAGSTEYQKERKRRMFEALNGEGMLDPMLTPVGVGQVEQLRATAERLVADAGVEAVLSSSLRRSLLTAAAFEGRRQCVPIVALDELREVAGAFECERRRPRTEIAAEFPSVDLRHCSAEDGLWVPFYRDALKAAVVRGVEALELIMARPESTLVVVSHGAFMAAAVFGSQHPCVISSCDPPRQNCEVQGVHLSRSYNDAGNAVYHINRLLAPGAEEPTSKL